MQHLLRLMVSPWHQLKPTAPGATDSARRNRLRQTRQSGSDQVVKGLGGEELADAGAQHLAPICCAAEGRQAAAQQADRAQVTCLLCSRRCQQGDMGGTSMWDAMNSSSS